jgi:cbb3-type cytochrome oxidase maturation protein
MEILYLLVPVSVALVFVIGVIFWRSLKGGQFEDLEGPGYRILMDDDRVRTETTPPEALKRATRSDVDPDQCMPPKS